MPALGFISEPNRTPAQQAAHAAASGLILKFALPRQTMQKGQKVALYNAWKDPIVVAEAGLTFDRIHQITGSCVWAGGTNAVFSTLAIQRLVAENPTKAFLPFTLHNYAMSRHYYGEDGQGEGSMGSTFAKSLKEDGIWDWRDTDPSTTLPNFTHTDGISVTSADEYHWSSYHWPGVGQVLPLAKPHLFGSAAECKTTDDVWAMIQNGYGVAFACDRYIGHASVKGSGADAYLVGSWDTYGPHQQSIHAVMEHPNDGPLAWAQNNWPGSTYPADPAGGPECGCWVTEAKVKAALTYHAEVYGLSHLSWFPAQPAVLDWVP